MAMLAGLIMNRGPAFRQTASRTISLSILAVPILRPWGHGSYGCRPNRADHRKFGGISTDDERHEPQYDHHDDPAQFIYHRLRPFLQQYRHYCQQPSNRCLDRNQRGPTLGGRLPTDQRHWFLSRVLYNGEY